MTVLSVSAGSLARALALAALGVVLALSAPASAAERVTGLVRIINSNDVGVNVYAEEFDYFGNSSWKRIGNVPPRSRVDFPNIPEGAKLGADVRGGPPFWGPYKVTYPKGGYPLRIFTLTKRK